MLQTAQRRERSWLEHGEVSTCCGVSEVMRLGGEAAAAPVRLVELFCGSRTLHSTSRNSPTATDSRNMAKSKLKG